MLTLDMNPPRYSSDLCAQAFRPIIYRRHKRTEAWSRNYEIAIVDLTVTAAEVENTTYDTGARGHDGIRVQVHQGEKILGSDRMHLVDGIHLDRMLKYLSGGFGGVSEAVLGH